MVQSERTRRLHKLAAGLEELGATSLTQVVATTETQPTRVHVGIFVGSFDSYPLCEALAKRDVETTDLLANCPDCKTVCRAARIDLYGLFDGIDENYNPYDEKWDKYAAC